MKALPMKSQLNKHTHRGFTLIELLVVVSIIGIIAALVVANVFGESGKARVTAAQADIATLENALKIYKLENGFYPSTDQGLKALVERATTQPAPTTFKQGGYINKLPNDPWGTPYVYLNPGLKKEIDLMSYGSDKVRGGEGEAADVTN
jgi:general secretion pathway protein G